LKQSAPKHAGIFFNQRRNAAASQPLVHPVQQNCTL
jgi:hypothetical protein